MKRILSLLLAGALVLLCACSAGGSGDTKKNEEKRYAPISAVDPCVVEPDERAVMTDSDVENYRALTEAMLSQRPYARLTDADRAEFLLDLLRRSPYYFFVESVEQHGGEVRFSYAYSPEEQAQMREFIDAETLKIANSEADAGDNQLDVVLKIYHAVGQRMSYDEERDDNKQLGSPLFDYPADEIYKAYKDNKALCYGFAYIMRFALLQRGIDCFCVYGHCKAHDMGHEWIIFKYKDKFYHCDPAWDRLTQGYCRLMHFGKTDGERAADTLDMRSFDDYHEAAYGEVKCGDDRFSIFRGMSRFSYISGHKYALSDIKGKKYTFDSESFSMEDRASDVQ